MGISRETDELRDLTIFSLSGKVSAEEIVQCIEQYWSEGPITRNTLWKGEGEDVSIAHLSGDDLRRIASVVARFMDRTDRRTGGKSVIVAPSDIDFGLSRIIEALHMNMTPDLPYAFKVFRTEAEALASLAEEN